MRFEDFSKTIDKDMRVEIYDKIGELIYNGRLSKLKDIPENILRIVPQATSREIYLEITVY